MDDTLRDPLATFAAGADPLALALVSLQPELLAAIQARLTHHGLLDPPADDYMGPLTPVIAKRLLSHEPILPLAPGPDFAGRIVRAMQSRGDWICRHPDAFTIAYVEHTEPDGQPSPARPNAFDDTRLLLRIAPDGRPLVVGAWHATTRSGSAAIDDPVDERGPPILDPGQYKAWIMGRTAIGTKLEQDALVQCVPLPVTRDADKDYSRQGDPAERGLFVIDQHGAFDPHRDDIGDTSAGCLVVQSQSGQTDFLASLRTDPRYRVNHAYRFMTALLTPGDLPQTAP